MTAVYVTLILSQGNGEAVSVLVFVLVMAGASFSALVAAVVKSPAVARRLLVVSTVLFALVGVLGILTIGLPFLIAAGMSAWGAARAN